MPHPDHEKNRALWNETVDLHYSHPRYRVKEFMEGASSLLPLERQELPDVRGKKLLHLQCQFGQDTLSWAREGAIVTGADISDQSIKRANELKALARLEGRFVRSDILDLIGVIDERFDIIYHSYGVLCWLGDVKRLAQVVAHYLKPGGTYLLIDGHPISYYCMDGAPGYFAKEPERFVGQPDYCQRDHLNENEGVEWQHPVADILNAFIGAGLTIEKVGEYDFSYYPVHEDWIPKGDGYWYPPTGPTPYPMILLVRVKKPL